MKTRKYRFRSESRQEGRGEMVGVAVLLGNGTSVCFGKARAIELRDERVG